jgi:hypothetical protein
MRDGSVRMSRRVTGNTAGGAIGGGVFNVGAVTHSTISGNTAAEGGGADSRSR